MSEPQYKRVLLKLSGEALAGEASRGIKFFRFPYFLQVLGQMEHKLQKPVKFLVTFHALRNPGNSGRRRRF